MKYFHFFKPTLTAMFMLLFITSCSNSSKQETAQQYQQRINEWHKERAHSLTEEDSWLSLAGLYTLSDGSSSFGADSSNDIVFPEKAAPTIGTITKDDSLFRIRIKPKATVRHDSSKVSSMQLQPDQQDEPTIFRHNHLLWYIIERRGTYYIRLKDTKHKNLQAFHGIEHFPISKKWHIKAQFNAFEEAKVISIPDVLGDVYQERLHGVLEFNMDGQQYSIAPLGHPQKDEELFVIFGDQTNGESTYSGGRYMYVPTPDEDGTVYIDFNKAYNPPCVFTTFATCPLPPLQNRLDLAISAGEKMYPQE